MRASAIFCLPLFLTPALRAQDSSPTRMLVNEVVGGKHVPAVVPQQEDTVKSLTLNPDKDAIDIRFVSGSGFYVPSSKGFVAKTTHGVSESLSEVILEVISAAEGKKACFPFNEKGCTPSQVFVRVWLTKDSPATAIRGCYCVETNVLDLMPKPITAPGLPSREAGVPLILNEADRGMQIYRHDGTEVSSAGYSKTWIEDLGPAGRDVSGIPYRFARLYLRDGNDAVKPLNSNEDKIYLVTDGGPTPDSQSVMAHAKAGNIRRMTGNAPSELSPDNVNDNMYFVPQKPNSNSGKIYQHQADGYRPINGHEYRLWENHSSEFEGFRETRNGGQEMPVALTASVPPKQRMPDPGFLETKNVLLSASSYEERLANTMNQYIKDKAHQYRPRDLRVNAYGKVSLRLFDRAPNQGILSGEHGLSGLLDIDAKGPGGKFESFTESQTESQLYLHYNSEPKERQENYDTWGQPSTVCATHVFAARWKEECLARMDRLYQNMGTEERVRRMNACSLQIGDLSTHDNSGAGGGKCALRHRSHFAGNCVDVRATSYNALVRGAPSSSGPKESKSGVAGRDAIETTWEAIRFAQSMGAITDEAPRWKARWQEEGHLDHFHICFPVDHPPPTGLQGIERVMDASIRRHPKLAAKIKNGPLRGCYNEF